MDDDRIDPARRTPRSDVPFRRGVDVVEAPVAKIEGAPLDGICRLGLVLVGDEALVTRSFRGKGLIDPPHKHDDHEAIGMLLSGRLELVIGGETFVAGPGDSWLHRRGVVHSSVALEDCVQIEVKSPPRRTWPGPEETR